MENMNSSEESECEDFHDNPTYGVWESKVCCGGNNLCIGGARPKIKPSTENKSLASLSSNLIGSNELLPTSSRDAKKVRSPWQGGSMAQNNGEIKQSNLIRHQSHSDSDSSNEDNGCIYTYKGNGSLSESNFDWGLEPNPDVQSQRVSSPEMDFLEMDFDPGQSNGHESSNSSISCQVSDIGGDSDTNLSNSDDNNLGDSNAMLIDQQNVSRTTGSSNIQLCSESIGKPDGMPVPIFLSVNSSYPPSNLSFLRDASYILPSVNTGNSNTTETLESSLNQDCQSDESSCPKCAETHSLKVAQNCTSCTSQNVLNKGNDQQLTLGVDSTYMIWSTSEAKLKQSPILGNLSCGRSAVLNVLESFGQHHEASALSIPHRADQPSTSKTILAHYLFDRSNSGTPPSKIFKLVEELSGGSIGGKFFPTFPQRDINILSWLIYWLKQGAIPILCLNPQKSSSQKAHQESWMYQMLYGLGPTGAHLCSPLECIPIAVLFERLCSPSEIIIGRGEIVCRWDKESDLSPLLKHKDHNWKRYNVLGQVVNIIREVSLKSKFDNMKNVIMPTVMRAGIFLFMEKTNASYKKLMESPEFRILNERCQQEQLKRL